MSLITSRQNPRVKALVRLRERRERQATGRFLIEGLRETERALDAGVRVGAFYFCPELWRGAAGAEALRERLLSAGSELVELTPEVFEKVSGRDGPDGILAEAEALMLDLETLKLPEAPLLLVVEGVEKPGNLGALLRTADAVGVTAVLCADPLTDFGNPQVIRNSQGAVFSVPCVAAESDAVLAYLRANQVRLAATTPDAQAEYWDADLRGGVALCVGNEHSGLSDAWLDAADLRLRIPMHGGADSLNVSVSAALCLYEAQRQRRA